MISTEFHLSRCISEHSILERTIITIFKIILCVVVYVCNPSLTSKTSYGGR